nr:CCAAT/enhancer-binding protein zeta-like [Procambarus clarkii]
MGKIKMEVKKKTYHLQQHGKVKKPLKQDYSANIMKKVSNIKKNLCVETVDTLHGSHNKQLLDNPSKNKRKKNKKESKNKFRKLQDNEVSSTTPFIIDPIQKSSKPSVLMSSTALKNQCVNLSLLWINYKQRSTPLVKAQSDWYMQLMNEEPEKLPTDSYTKQKLKDLAGEILKHDVINYNQIEERGSKMQEVKFRKTVLSHGTSRDKVAALVLRCMEAPVHSLNHLNSLIAMVTAKSKSGYEDALSSLIELFTSTLLPDRRTIKKFEEHSFSCLNPFVVSNRELAEKQLALWYFEDQLACAYQKLIRQLTEVSHDTVDKNKLKGVRSLVDLLTNNPSQEASLIVESVINKLGDPSRKVAAQTMYLLRTLLQRRPTLKIQVVTSVEVMLYRPNVNEKSQYYCLCFLKDMIFSKDDHRLAAELLKLYFGFFKACTKKGEVNTRLMSALLRGINRAFPYSQLEGNALEEQLDTLYKLCHLVNFAIATQALQLIYQVLSSKQLISDRFFQVLYKQLQDPAFGFSSANSAFLNLIFKALVFDDSLQRIQAFIKRLLQTCQYQSCNMICGILYLISEVVKEKPGLKTMTQMLLRNYLFDCNDDDDDGLEVFSDAEDLNEVESTEEDKESYKNIDKVLTVTEKRNDDGYISVSGQENAAKSNLVKPSALSSWVHSLNTGPTTSNSAVYDPYHRNPLYCGAEYSPLWELAYLQAHYHPSVSLFATKLIAGESIDYSGDPLQDFTLMRFLDRFVYKNPKKMEGQTDGAGGNVLGRRTQYVPQGARRLAVNTEEFCALDPEKVPVDEQFFYRYFTQYKTTLKTEPVDKEDADSVEDEEFDEYMRRMQGVSADDLDVDDDVDFASGASSAAKANKDDSENDEDDSIFGGDSDDASEHKLSIDNDDDVDNDNWHEFVDEDEVDDFDCDDLNLDDEEAVDFSGDDFDMDKPRNKEMKEKFTSKGTKKKESDSLSSMFVSAESFAHMLEENADGMMNPITTQSLANKDRANAKQLHWEVDRDRNFKEFDWRKKKQGIGRSGGQRRERFRSDRAKDQFKTKRGGFKKFKKRKTH